MEIHKVLIYERLFFLKYIEDDGQGEQQHYGDTMENARGHLPDVVDPGDGAVPRPLSHGQDHQAP